MLNAILYTKLKSLSHACISWEQYSYMYSVSRLIASNILSLYYSKRFRVLNICLFAKLGHREPQAMLKFSNYWCVSRSSNITIIIKWIKFKSIIDTLQKNCFYLLIYTSIYWAWKILWLNHEIKEHVAFDMYGTYIDRISVTITPVPINCSVYLYYTQNLIKWYPLNYNWPFIHI